jgi:hypothetical protein
MDELQRQMREIAAAVAGGARAPGAASARTRGRRLRRRARGGAVLLAVVLVVASVPAAVRLGVPGLMNAPVIGSLVRQLDTGFGKLTLDRYEHNLSGTRHVDGRLEVVASGRSAGERWRIVAYRVRDDGDAGALICTSTESEGDPDGPDSSCAAESTPLTWTGRLTPDAWLVTGFTAGETTAVRLRLDDGRVIDAALYPGPDGLPVTFFAADVRPAGDPTGWRAGTITAIGAGGRSLCQQQIGADLPVRTRC